MSTTLLTEKWHVVEGVVRLCAARKDNQVLMHALDLMSANDEQRDAAWALFEELIGICPEPK